MNRKCNKWTRIALLGCWLLSCLFMVRTTAFAASVPVIKNGSYTNLKGDYVTVQLDHDLLTTGQMKNDTPAMRINGNVMIPLKQTFCDHGPGFTYMYKGGNKSVTINNGKRKVIFYIGKKYASVNGMKMNLILAPYLVTFRKSGQQALMVPLGQTASFLGYAYSYNNSSKKAIISTREDIGASATQTRSIAKSKFINTIGPLAAANYRRTGIRASVTMAQAILESGWGQSTLAENGNNLFGMKKSLSGNSWAGSSWDGVNTYTKKTYEYGKKGRYQITAAFRKYSCAEDSIEDHSAYLLGAMNGSKKRYAGITSAPNYRKQIEIIKKGGYATSGSYVSQLCNLIASYHLDKWDSYIPPKQENKPNLDQPVSPVDPVNPVNPTEPVNPANPVSPANPTEPVNPENPADPGKSEPDVGSPSDSGDPDKTDVTDPSTSGPLVLSGETDQKTDPYPADPALVIAEATLSQFLWIK